MAAAPPPRAVLFDLGGVVCRFHPGRRLQALARAAALPASEVRARLWDSGFDRACDEGRHDAAAMHARINALLGTALSRETLQGLWASAFEPDPAALALVAAARTACPVHLLSDNSALLEAALPRHLPAVAAAFDGLWFSHRFGRLKADPALFGAVAGRLGLPAGALLLVDDSPRALESARNAGLRGLAFASAARAEAPLRALLGLD